jgi:hypothetical protein
MNLIYGDEVSVRIVVLYEYICTPFCAVGFEMPVIELVSSCRVMEVIFLTDVRNMKTRF